jgi:hypothetical protein
LIGRNVSNPIALQVQASALPSTPEGRLVITVIIINRSIGTVPLIFNENQIRIGNDGTSGMGIEFDVASQLNSGPIRQDTPTVPTNNIRVLGPRQRCVIKIEFTGAQLAQSPALLSGSANVRAFYNVNSAGIATAVNNSGSAPSLIYADQGFKPGRITSDLVPLLPSAP